MLIILFSGCFNDDENLMPTAAASAPSLLLKKMSFTGILDYSLEFNYNPDNTLERILYTVSNNTSSQRFTYLNGLLDRADYYDSNGNATGRYKQFIYSDGILQERRDFENFSTLKWRYTYSYSAEGKIREINVYDAN